jgi:hypothetical protein
MSLERRALIVGLVGYLVAVAFAALFSGSAAAPLTAVPIALATGCAAGWLLTR